MIHMINLSEPESRAWRSVVSGNDPERVKYGRFQVRVRSEELLGLAKAFEGYKGSSSNLRVCGVEMKVARRLAEKLREKKKYK